MRKFTKLFLRFFLALGVVILFYLSKKTFEIKDLRSDSLNDHRGLSIDTIHKDDLGSKHKSEDAENNNRILYENDNEENGKNVHANSEDKIIEPVQDTIIKPDEEIRDANNGIINFIKEDEQHSKKDNQRKPLELPPFVSDSPDDGPGEHGKPEILVLKPEEEKEKNRLYALNYFNQYLSDRISVHRRLDDTRIQGCKDLTYPQNLPMASVIICFHNEAWSVLLRSVHSILDRSPPELLREIILVDDFSTMDHLKDPLDQYMGGLEKVKVVRASKREGLIRGRLLGYDVATGPVLVFLDSHIECIPGWLEPLVARIAEDPKAVVFPMIPRISSETFSAFNMNSNSVGTFRWNGLFFMWKEMSPNEAKRRTRETDPIRSPTMPGGLFAVDKQWFTTLGTYDQQMDYWGGENMELSFKSWMCNGSIEMIPCSQVGHIYRSQNPIKWSVDGVLAKNSIRVAEVWMDEYKQIVFDLSFTKSDFGDVSDRKRLRDSLHCHDFKWYLDNVLEFTPPTLIAHGEIRSESGQQCLDSMGDKNIPELYPCHGAGYNQRWAFTDENFIMQGLHKKLCYEEEHLQINGCRDSNNVWWLNFQKGTVQHSESGLCLELRIPKTLTMAKCNGSNNQRWILPERKTT